MHPCFLSESCHSGYLYLCAVMQLLSPQILTFFITPRLNCLQLEINQLMLKIKNSKDKILYLKISF
jgi:hypothetical protein